MNVRIMSEWVSISEWPRSDYEVTTSSFIDFFCHEPFPNRDVQELSLKMIRIVISELSVIFLIEKRNPTVVLTCKSA